MSQNPDTLLYIPRFYAIGLYLIYIIISQWLFLATIQGWAALGDLLLVGWILPLYWLILIVSVLSRPGLYISKNIFFKLVIIIIIFQIISLLLNYGNCSGSPKEFNFIQRVYIEHKYNEYICWISGLIISPWVNMGIVYFIRIIFYILNLVLIIGLISTNKTPNP